MKGEDVKQLLSSLSKHNFENTLSEVSVSVSASVAVKVWITKERKRRRRRRRERQTSSQSLTDVQNTPDLIRASHDKSHECLPSQSLMILQESKRYGNPTLTGPRASGCPPVDTSG